MSGTITYTPPTEVFYLCSTCGERHRSMEHCAEKEESGQVVSPSGGCSRCDGPFTSFRSYRLLGESVWDLCESCAEAFQQFMTGAEPRQNDDSAPVAGLG